MAEPIEQCDVTVIGAGMAGVTCAERLQKSGLRVCILEKSRGAGGRMSTRRVGETLAFDHGCQYFQAESPTFRAAVEEWKAKGHVASWDPIIAEINGRETRLLSNNGPGQFVGCPGMNSLLKAQAAILSVKYETRATKLIRNESGWQIIDGEGNVVMKTTWVVSTAPPVQSTVLFAGYNEITEKMTTVKMSPCWCAMLAFERSFGCDFDAARCEDNVLSWIAKNNSKPGRGEGFETWCLHANPDWSARTLESEPADILPKLKEAFFDLVSQAHTVTTYETCHRWRYALTEINAGLDCIASANLRAIVCGDWCLGNRVEHAFLSGMAAAEFIKNC